MPEHAGVAQPDGRAVVDDVGNDQHFRVARQRELVQHMALQRAPALRKSHLLRRRDVLVAEHQHMVFQMCRVQPREGVFVQRLRQVQADDFSAQRGLKWPHLERCVCSTLLPLRLERGHGRDGGRVHARAPACTGSHLTGCGGRTAQGRAMGSGNGLPLRVGASVRAPACVPASAPACAPVPVFAPVFAM